VATVVAFHAHPDDEALLTGGTIARLAAEGHRVIVVVACDGDVWAGTDQGRRLDELCASAEILGAEQVVHRPVPLVPPRWSGLTGRDRHGDPSSGLPGTPVVTAPE